MEENSEPRIDISTDLFVRLVEAAYLLPTHFALDDLYEEGSFNEQEQKIIWEEITLQQTPIISQVSAKPLYYLSLDGRQKYFDYVELKEARRNSESARKTAAISIWIAVLSLLITLLFQIFGTSKVKVIEVEYKPITDLIETTLEFLRDKM